MNYKINYAADIVLVTGDREWDDLQEVYTWLDRFDSIKLVVHGTARGADHLAEDWARTREVPYLGVPAEWTKRGKAAGPIRNSAMLSFVHMIEQAQGKDSVKVQVLAFHENIKKSKGTKDMIKKADKEGYDVYLVDKQ